MRLRISNIRRISFNMHSICIKVYLLFRRNVSIIQRGQLNLDHFSKRGRTNGEVVQVFSSSTFYSIVRAALACQKANKQQFPLKISNDNICGIEMLFNKSCYIFKFLFISQPTNDNLYRINFLIIFREWKMVCGW